jgi:hypothetical protein
MEALAFFQQAVEDAVQDKMQVQEAKLQTECTQWQQQLEEQ